MILSAELQMDGYAHLKFNAGFTAALSCLCGKLLHVGGGTQNGLLKKQLPKAYSKKMSFKNINNGYYQNKRWMKEIVSLIAVIRLFFIIRKTDPELVMILSASPLTKYVLFRMNRILKRKIVFVIHGELEGILQVSSNPLKQSFWTNRFIDKINGSSYLLFLGERIFRNASAVFKNSISSKSIIYHHPFVFEKEHSHKISKKSGVTACMTGTASRAKCAEQLFVLSDILRKDVLDKKVSFNFAGTVSAEIRKCDNGLVGMHTQKTLITDENYSKRIIASDVVVYFYRDEKYSLTTSGAFFDILSYERPVVALDCELIREFFDCYGKLGFLCKSIDEMARYIKKISSDKKVLEKFRSSIRKAKQKWTVKKYADELFSVLAQKGILVK